MSEPLVSSQDALEQLRRSDQRWDAAIRAFDPYPARLRALAQAAEFRSRALTMAHLANITQKPRAGASNLQSLAHELSAASNRPGPKAAWRRFDQAVTDLGAALEGGSITALAQAFESLSTITSELAETCEAELSHESAKAS
jgi:hypothetical protein